MHVRGWTDASNAGADPISDPGANPGDPGADPISDPGANPGDPAADASVATTADTIRQRAMLRYTMQQYC